MFEGGLLEEVRGLLARGLSPDARPLRAIGYRQAVAVLRGEMARSEAEAEIVTATMQYAKRQRTWFRHQLDGVWCYGDAREAAARSAASGEARKADGLRPAGDRPAKCLTKSPNG